MTTEITVLTYAALLQVVQFALMSITANLDVGPGKTMSARDPSRLGKPVQELLSEKPGRLFRAFNNHFEGLILFTIAVVVVTLGEQSTGFTAICAWVYLGARVLYIPAYYYGLAPGRSIIWFVGFLATVFMLLATLV
ncbi:MAPEG family protein [Neptunicoccus cionae]|uniref:Membrane protein n=1 Tax=Neptunicoccus cionae TaxID=2035344 RepID=A0A916QXN1_9RHOB|nr:MAPEG family protein [Amylibacter cionae]GGA21857.1 membrane protein [Amylibacter cionae]